MDELPELGLLSIAEKDDLIRALFAQVAALTTKVTELEGRLALNSQNSSKPPSSDGLNKPKPKSHKAGQNPTGGQKGHVGHTLASVAQPDHIEAHSPPSHCDAYHRPLPPAVVVETRQVFDIPPLRHEVTEHQALEACCVCGEVHRGEFPVAVSAPASSDHFINPSGRFYQIWRKPLRFCRRIRSAGQRIPDFRLNLEFSLFLGALCNLKKFRLWYF